MAACAWRRDVPSALLLNRARVLAPGRGARFAWPTALHLTIFLILTFVTWLVVVAVPAAE